MIADLLSTISKLPSSNLPQSINDATTSDRNAQSAARQQTPGKTGDKSRLDYRISSPNENELNSGNKTEVEEKGEIKDNEEEDAEKVKIRPRLEKTSQELRMLSSVTIDCQITKIVMIPGSQLSVLLSVAQMSQVTS